MKNRPSLITIGFVILMIIAAFAAILSEFTTHKHPEQFWQIAIFAFVFWIVSSLVDRRQL